MRASGGGSSRAENLGFLDLQTRETTVVRATLVVLAGRRDDRSLSAYPPVPARYVLLSTPPHAIASPRKRSPGLTHDSYDCLHAEPWDCTRHARRDPRSHCAPSGVPHTRPRSRDPRPLLSTRAPSSALVPHSPPLSSPTPLHSSRCSPGARFVQRAVRGQRGYVSSPAGMIGRRRTRMRVCSMTTIAPSSSASARRSRDAMSSAAWASGRRGRSRRNRMTDGASRCPDARSAPKSVSADTRTRRSTDGTLENHRVGSRTQSERSDVQRIMASVREHRRQAL